MARHSLVELDNASDGYYRPPRRRRKHRSHRHEDDPSLASYVDPPGSPDLDELRRARTSYYERSPESRRRRTEEGRRVEPEAHYSRRSDGSFDRQDTASRRHRRRYTEDDMRRRHRRRDEDGDASVVYVYQDDHPRGDDRGGHRDRYGPPRRDLKTDKARVIRSARTGELIQERIPRRADRSPKDGRYEESMAQLERGGTVSHRPLTRTTSVREPERTRTVRSPVKRSATTARPRPGSVVGSVRHARASSASMAGNRPSIFSIFVPPAPHRPRIEKIVECVVCLSDDIPSSKAPRLACGHNMCHACLKRQFELSINDPQHMPPRCCTTEHIPLKYAERLLSDRFKTLWNKKYEEYMTRNRIYCPTRGCGAWIKPSHIRLDPTTGRKCGKCAKCGTKVCALCNGKWHTRRECPKDEATRQFVEMAQEKGWQRCYNCKAMVELKEGCYHMTCRCTAQFCMLCAKKWKTCDCPWFEVPPLDPGDRLMNMNIAQPIQTFFGMLQGRRDMGAPPPPVAMNRALPAGDVPFPPPPVTNRLQRNTSRRQHEEDGDRLARRFQNELRLDRGHRDDDTIEVEVYGNAGGHHMNESYTVRPFHARSAPPPARRSWLFGSRPSRRSQVITRDSRASTPTSSLMAGLSRDGTRRGAARVGTWLQYVENDPAEVEGRNSVVQPED